MPLDRNAGTILSIFIQTVEENQNSKGVKLRLTGHPDNYIRIGLEERRFELSDHGESENDQNCFASVRPA